MNLFNWFRRYDTGTINGFKARRHRKTGRVQFRFGEWLDVCAEKQHLVKWNNNN